MRGRDLFTWATSIRRAVHLPNCNPTQRCCEGEWGKRLPKKEQEHSKERKREECTSWEREASVLFQCFLVLSSALLLVLALFKPYRSHLLFSLVSICLFFDSFLLLSLFCRSSSLGDLEGRSVVSSSFHPSFSSTSSSSLSLLQLFARASNLGDLEGRLALGCCQFKGE